MNNKTKYKLWLHLLSWCVRRLTSARVISASEQRQKLIACTLVIVLSMTTWDVDIEVLGRTAWSLCIQNLLDHLLTCGSECNKLNTRQPGGQLHRKHSDNQADRPTKKHKERCSILNWGKPSWSAEYRIADFDGIWSVSTRRLVAAIRIGWWYTSK